MALAAVVAAFVLRRRHQREHLNDLDVAVLGAESELLTASLNKVLNDFDVGVLEAKPDPGSGVDSPDDADLKNTTSLQDIVLF